MESEGYSLKTNKSNQPGPENNILIKRIKCNNLTNEHLILTLGLKGDKLGTGLHRLDCIYCWELPGKQHTNLWVSRASLGVLSLIRPCNLDFCVRMIFSKYVQQP